MIIAKKEKQKNVMTPTTKWISTEQWKYDENDNDENLDFWIEKEKFSYASHASQSCFDGR